MNRTWESHELTQLKGKSLHRKDPTTYNAGKSKMIRTAEVTKLPRAVVIRTKLVADGQLRGMPSVVARACSYIYKLRAQNTKSQLQSKL